MRGGFEVFDYDEGTGLDAEEWIDRLSKQAARQVPVPAARCACQELPVTLQRDRDVPEQGRASGREHRLNAQRKKADSINAARKVLRVTRFDGKRSAVTLLDAMRFHHFKYDEETAYLFSRA